MLPLHPPHEPAFRAPGVGRSPADGDPGEVHQMFYGKETLEALKHIERCHPERSEGSQAQFPNEPGVLARPPLRFLALLE
jgi:hypothetical protein